MQNHALAALAALLMVASIDVHAATFSDHNWTGMGGYPGADGEVTETVVDASGNLYIAGEFSIVGDTFANCIAKWDGTNWSALGSGLQGNDGFRWVVFALAVSGNDLYVAGHFTMAGGVPANSIAKWNGTNWSALGSGITGGVCCGAEIGGVYPAYVYGLAVSGNDVYAAGAFTIAGGTPANYIAKWNGSSWSPLGSGLNGGAGPLAVSGNDLYVAGYFTMAGGSPATNIAKWNGSSWSVLGSGVQGFDYLGHPDASVYALAASGSDLYAAGFFTKAGGSPATNIAKWNGSSWSAVGSGVEGVVNALTISGSDVFAAADIDIDSYITYITKWNGSSWSSPNLGITSEWVESGDTHIYALAASGTNLYAGGGFRSAGNKTAHCIAKWNGSNWSPMGAARSSVSRMAASSRDVYGMVSLVAADGTGTNFLGKWNGSGWSRVGTGTVDIIQLAVSGSDLYAVGTFTNVGITANMARWDGGTWSALGSGVNGNAALVVSGTNVYAAGQFTMAGGVAANKVARWNGSSWSPLGSGLESGDGNAFVSSVTASGNDLYVIGHFTSAGGIAANNVAKWNGSSWSPLGPGLETFQVGYFPYVPALAVGNNLYVGGGVNTFQIARWDGTKWSALPELEHFNADGPDLWSMAASGTDLYVGGWLKAGNAYYVAKWNGGSWSALGSGVNGTVFRLAATDTELFVGGNFTTAGGKVAPYMARARIGSTAQAVTTSNSTASIRFSGVTGYPYDVQRATNLTPPVVWTTMNATPLYPAADGSFTFIDSNATPGTAFYRSSAIGLGPPACPELGLQYMGTNLISGFSSVDFGVVALDGSVSKTFTITNSGTRALSILNVNTDSRDEFTVDLTGMLTTVPAGGSTTFTVIFSPIGTGSRWDELFIVTEAIEGCYDSNDGFPISVTGTGF